MSERQQRAIRTWLISLWLLVLIMVMVGGITRLTGSGLSIVEWRPVTGALPPLSEAAWVDAFEAYRHSPQFVHQNSWMQLSDFKQIYFWEYAHRLLGRLIGLLTFVPWLYFAIRGYMTRRVALRTFSLLILGGMQGLLGWWMVKSGLVNEPRVSHYRLAAHLILAFGVGQWILWQALDLLGSASSERLAPRLRYSSFGVVPLVILQLIYGAFMAGTRAGYLAATFPDMNGHYAPAYFFSASDIGRSLLSNPMTIHYVHRVLAFALLGYALWLAIALRDAGQNVRAAAWFFLGAVLGQGLLGVMTVMLRVPIGVAVVHQGGAYVLCGAAVLLLHAVRSTEPEIAKQRGAPVAPAFPAGSA
ncbi:MAG TPA: COX15/CtaA family protein [Polyangiales bacterium]|nr:COX15/CtaA family protein [Polyangiales bacterium]